MFANLASAALDELLPMFEFTLIRPALASSLGVQLLSTYLLAYIIQITQHLFLSAATYYN